MAADNRPTAKQLRYLRSLCEATGETRPGRRPARKPRARSSDSSSARAHAEERRRDRREVKDALARGSQR